MERAARKLQLPAVVAALSAALCGSLSHAAIEVTLPDPTLFVDGNPVALPIDDFLSYPANVMIEWQDLGWLPEATFGDFRLPGGIGLADLIIYTQSGQKNDGLPGAGDLEHPLPAATGTESSFEGWWGQNNQDNNATPGPPTGGSRNPGPVYVLTWTELRTTSL